MMKTFAQTSFAAPASRQRGVVLAIALIVLVAMTLAGIALVRSVDTGTQVAGNVAFRGSAVNSTDAGVQAARAWLLNPANANLLTGDNPASGYYATWQETDAVRIDVTGSTTPTNPADDVNWDGANGAAIAQPLSLGTDGSGNEVAYVIHRMCNLPGVASRTTCSSWSPPATGGVSAGTTKGVITQKPPDSLDQFYYRVTVRSKGPRNSVSFIQAMILM